MTWLALSATTTAQLPDPGDEPADMREPVQVFILLGQSNMLGFGKIKGGDGSLEHAVKEKGLYPYLVGDAGGLLLGRQRAPHAGEAKRDVLASVEPKPGMEHRRVGRVVQFVGVVAG